MARKAYTVLTPAQRLMVAQMILTFDGAKYQDIARVAGVSNATVGNIARNLAAAAVTAGRG